MRPTTARAAATAIVAGVLALALVSGAWALDTGVAKGDTVRFNLDLREAQIREALLLIGKASGTSIVPGKGIDGAVNLSLREVTVDEALDILCSAYGLYRWQVANAYVVSSTPPPTGAAPYQQPSRTQTGWPTLAPSGNQLAALPSAALPGKLAALIPRPKPTAERAEQPKPKKQDMIVGKIQIKFIDCRMVAEIFGGRPVGAQGRYSWTDEGTVTSDLNLQLSGKPRRRALDTSSLAGWNQYGGGGYGGRSGGYGGQSGGYGGRSGGYGGGGYGGGGYGGGGYGGGGYGGGGYGGGGNVLLLPEGISPDVPPLAYTLDNSLIVKGTPEAIDELRELIAQFDIRAKQVQIEAKFVEVDTSAIDSMGINWNVANGLLTVNGLIPAGGGTLRVQYATGNFNAVLDALKSQNKARILHAPRITCENGSSPYLDFTTEYPYFSSQVQTTEYGREVSYSAETVSAGTTLQIMPRVNADDTIWVWVQPTISDRIADRAAPDGTSYPIIASRSIQTAVTVQDGETIVLGGMVRSTENVTVTGLPLLQDLPIIGRLFQRRERSIENSELLIFVTPSIVRDIPRL